uniref:Putative secreted protein n=1 Tax=Anopheles triannulatus TaxID=58253 RepID=A0A2M4B662_9DIPT
MFGGMTLVCMAMMHFVSEQIPAAASECPMFDLTDPTNNGSVRSGQNTFSIASHSSGSPTTVPVLCAST